MPLSVCGGIGVGAVAAGGNAAPFSGLSQTITLDRDVVCDAIVYVICGVMTKDAAVYDGGLSLSSVTDSVGGTYVVSTSTKALIGLTSQDFVDGNGFFRSMMLGSALRVVSAGVLSAADTITITWTATHANARMIALAMVLTGISDNAAEQHGLIVYGNGASFPASGSSTDLSYPFVFGGGYKPMSDPECAWVSGLITYGPTISVAPEEGVVLGQTSTTDITDGDLNIFVSAIPDTAPSSLHDPGWTWTNAADGAIVNYQTIALSGGGVVFDSGWTHRLDS